jgi:uncharacterized membrane protein
METTTRNTEPATDRSRPMRTDASPGNWTSRQTLPGVSTNGNQRESANESPGLQRALGWFSLGLGLAQIIAPEKVANLIGIERKNESLSMMRVVGAREIASGLGILTQSKSAPWLWARVGGDAMDIALLTSARSSPHADQNRVAAATAAVIGIAAIDALASTRQTTSSGGSDQMSSDQSSVRVASAVTVQAPVEDVFSYWNDFQGLPRFMSDAASVEITGDRQSQWTVPAPVGTTVEWDVQITNSAPNDYIAWETAEGSRIAASGDIRFRTAAGNRGTQVIFTAQFNPPGGELGKKIAQPLAEVFGTKITNDLRRFKQLVEVGEIVHSDDSIVPGPNPAQPRPQAGISGA